MQKRADIDTLTTEELRRMCAALADEVSSLREEKATLSAQLGVLAADNDSLAAENAQAHKDIDELVGALREAQKELDRLNEIVATMQHSLYGAKSEKSKKSKGKGGGGDLETFNKAEEEAAKKESKKRAPKAEPDYSGMEQEDVEHTLSGDRLSCPHCHSQLEDMGYDVKLEVSFVPARLVLRRHKVHKYVCRECSRANARGEDEDVPVFMVRADAPVLPLGNSHAGASTIAHILHEKYALSQPLERTWKELSTKYHLPDKRNTMCRWVVESYRRWFSQVHGLLQAELLKRNLLHIDETTVVCLEERKKKRREAEAKGTGEPTGASKSYMWVFCTAKGDANPVYYYRFGPSRGREVVDDVLPAWSGAIMTDAHSAYRALPKDSFTRIACGVHIRRYFVRAVIAKTPGSTAQEGVDRLDRIFHLEHVIEKRTSDPKIIKKCRKRLIRPLMDSFIEWAVDRRDNYALPDTKLHEALCYAINNWDDFSNILLDGRYPLSNNRAENAIRPFCVGRRNWLFSDSSYGAEVSAGIYSIVTTARANGLDDERYMTWLLTEMPKVAAEGTLKERLADFLPWAGKVPTWCRSGSREELFADDPVVDVDPTEFDRD